jgi:hypothetical protein
MKFIALAIPGPRPTSVFRSPGSWVSGVWPRLLTSGRCTQADDVMGEVVYAGRRMSSDPTSRRRGRLGWTGEKQGPSGQKPGILKSGPKS